MRTFKFLGLSMAAVATSMATMTLLVGCSKKLTQKEVNRQTESAHLAVADANKTAEVLGREARAEIANVDRPRIEKVAQLQSDLQTKPNSDGPKLNTQIDETNREANRKIVNIQEKKLAKQESVIRKANEKTEKAERTAAAYEAQKMQKAYVDACQQELAKYDEKIAELKLRRENLAGDARTLFDRRMKTLELKRSTAGMDLDNMISAKPEEWTTFREEVSKTFNEMKAAFNEAAQPPAFDLLGSTP